MAREIGFDERDAIEKAMHVFWSKGYEGASLKDLMQATNLQKGSLYNSFKSKENLFLLCLERYGQLSRSFFYHEGDPKKYLRQFFDRLISEGLNKDNVKGCLIMNTCLEFSNSKAAPATQNQALFSAIELNFKNVVLAYSKEHKCDVEKLKTNLVTAAFSIREISKFKKDKEFLEQIANNTLRDFGIIISDSSPLSN